MQKNSVPYSSHYINPLLFALCGFLFFREQLYRLQALAVLLAIAAVANMVISYGQVPEAAILLASTFVTYGMLHKYVAVAPIPGLLIETTILGLPMAGYIASQAALRAAASTASESSSSSVLAAPRFPRPRIRNIGPEFP